MTMFPSLYGYDLPSIFFVFLTILVGSGKSNRASSICEDIASKEAVKWRKIANEYFCNTSAAAFKENSIMSYGGWCLRKAVKGEYKFDEWLRARRTYGFPVSYYVIPDVGIAKTIAKYVKQRPTFVAGTSTDTPTSYDRSVVNVSLFDIGAGVGQYGVWFRFNAPYIVWEGFDGAGNVESFTNGSVRWIDVTDPLYDTIGNRRADWVMSLEVGEHIAHNASLIFLDLLSKHSNIGVILSWAVKGQGGHGHINEKDNEEVVRISQNVGLVQTAWTKSFQNEARKLAQYRWFRESFMVFVKNDTDIMS
jgi:hypothetical protein